MEGRGRLCASVKSALRSGCNRFFASICWCVTALRATLADQTGICYFRTMAKDDVIETPPRSGRPRIHQNDRERWRKAQAARRQRLRDAATCKKPRAIFSSQRGEWGSPPELIGNVLSRLEIDCFCLDPASPGPGGPVPARRYFTKEEDGLCQEWVGEHVWLNPPYGRHLAKWVRKAVSEWHFGRAKTIVLLLPARTDTLWWHELITAGGQPEFLKGRVRFLDTDGQRRDVAPFASVLVWLRPQVGDQIDPRPQGIDE